MLWTKFALRYQEALYAELEAKRAGKVRKPKAAPAPKVTIPKRRERVGIDCGESRTNRQTAAIAAQALALLGETLPATRDQATDLLDRLSLATV